MKRILVLCRGNSARSQMAQAYLQQFVGDQVDVLSAGTNPKSINPLAIQVLAEDGIDIAHHTSNHVDEYATLPIDYVITVCDKAREQCPYFPTVGERLHHSFPEPSHLKGPSATTEEKLSAFREVRDLIKVYCQDFVAQRRYEFSQP